MEKVLEAFFILVLLSIVFAGMFIAVFKSLMENGVFECWKSIYDRFSTLKSRYRVVASNNQYYVYNCTEKPSCSGDCTVVAVLNVSGGVFSINYINTTYRDIDVVREIIGLAEHSIACSRQEQVLRDAIQFISNLYIAYTLFTAFLAVAGYAELRRDIR